MAIRTLLIVGSALFASCATSPPHKEMQSIIRMCGLEGQLSFEVVGKRDIRITHLDPDTDYKDVDCLLRGVRKLGLDVGLVANEAPAPQ